MRSAAIYFLLLGIACLVFPPMLGFVTGVGGFCLLSGGASTRCSGASGAGRPTTVGHRIRPSPTGACVRGYLGTPCGPWGRSSGGQRGSWNPLAALPLGAEGLSWRTTSLETTPMTVGQPVNILAPTPVSALLYARTGGDLDAFEESSNRYLYPPFRRRS